MKTRSRLRHILNFRAADMSRAWLLEIRDLRGNPTYTPDFRCLVSRRRPRNCWTNREVLAPLVDGVYGFVLRLLRIVSLDLSGTVVRVGLSTDEHPVTGLLHCNHSTSRSSLMSGTDLRPGRTRNSLVERDGFEPAMRFAVLPGDSNCEPLPDSS